MNEHQMASIMHEYYCIKHCIKQFSSNLEDILFRLSIFGFSEILAILRGIRPHLYFNSFFFFFFFFFVFSGPPEHGEDSCRNSFPPSYLQPALHSAYTKRQWWSDHQHHQVQKPITDSFEHNESTQLSDLILTLTLHLIHQGPGPHLS